MARRGRKRKPQPRHKCGKVVQVRTIDRGTPEALARKIELVGPGDPVLAESALGILYANGIISREHMDAGFMYAHARFMASREYFDFPRPQAGISRYSDLVATHISSDSATEENPDSEAAKTYNALDASLRAISRTCRDSIYNVAVENRIPGWFVEGRVTLVGEKWTRRRKRFLSGLDVLCEAFMVRRAA